MRGSICSNKDPLSVFVPSAVRTNGFRLISDSPLLTMLELIFAPNPSVSSTWSCSMRSDLCIRGLSIIQYVSSQPLLKSRIFVCGIVSLAPAQFTVNYDGTSPTIAMPGPVQQPIFLQAPGCLENFGALPRLGVSKRLSLSGQMQGTLFTSCATQATRVCLCALQSFELRGFAF